MVESSAQLEEAAEVKVMDESSDHLEAEQAAGADRSLLTKRDDAVESSEEDEEAEDMEEAEKPKAKAKAKKAKAKASKKKSKSSDHRRRKSKKTEPTIVYHAPDSRRRTYHKSSSPVSCPLSALLTIMLTGSLFV